MSRRRKMYRKLEKKFGKSQMSRRTMCMKLEKRIEKSEMSKEKKDV